MTAPDAKMKMVQREPTQEMRAAGDAQGMKSCEHLWRAMFDEAPAPPPLRESPYSEPNKVAAAPAPSSDLAERLLRMARHFKDSPIITAADVGRSAVVLVEAAEALDAGMAREQATGEAEVARLTEEHRDLRDILLFHGFVPCDIPACNCGRWHPRYGLSERWDELKDALAESRHPLCNENGNNMMNALKELITERDALAAKLAEAEKDAARFRMLAFRAKRAMDQWDGIMWHVAAIHDPQGIGYLAAIDAAIAASKGK